MTIDLASASPEDLKPIADLMLTLPAEKRGEVALRVQRAAREFLAKAEDAQRAAAVGETDPVRRVVYAALAKQLPEPAPVLDPLRREALGSLVKAVTAGARASLEKGIAGAIGAKLGVGRAAGMKAMMSAARAGKAEGKALAARYRDYAAVGDGKKFAIERGVRRAMDARSDFNNRILARRRKAEGAAVLGAGAAMWGAAGYGGYKGGQAFNRNYEFQSPVRRKKDA